MFRQDNHGHLTSRTFYENYSSLFTFVLMTSKFPFVSSVFSFLFGVMNTVETIAASESVTVTVTFTIRFTIRHC